MCYEEIKWHIAQESKGEGLGGGDIRQGGQERSLSEGDLSEWEEPARGSSGPGGKWED